MYPPFEEVCSLYSAELNGLSVEAVERHPGDDQARWNARQIVEHLVLTHRLSGAAFRERLRKDRPTKTRATLAQKWMKVGVCGLGYFPSGREAPPQVLPALTPEQTLNGSAIAFTLTNSFQTLDELLDSCAERFGKQKIASHHVLGPLCADQWQRFHLAHARHHMKHVRNARRA
jgi:hypothetical protein